MIKAVREGWTVGDDRPYKGGIREGWINGYIFGVENVVKSEQMFDFCEKAWYNGGGKGKKPRSARVCRERKL